MSDISEVIAVIRYFQRQESVKLQAVDKCFSDLCEVAKVSGLTDELMTLCSTFISKHGGTSAIFQLVLKCMLPATTVSDEVVITVLSFMKRHFRKVRFGRGIVCGLQWVAGLLEFGLASEKCIGNFYHLFVALLERKDTEVISCWLVSRLTKPSDANRNLVLNILRLRAKSNSNCFDTVLFCFKTLKPECVAEAVITRNVISNSKVSQYFKEHFRKAQERNIASRHNISERRLDRVWKISAEGKRSAKRSQIDAIPGMDFVHFGSTLYKKKQKNIMEVNDWNQLVKHFWNVSLPCNLVSLLDNEFGQAILMYRGPELQQRLSYTLYSVLQSVIIDCSVNVSMREQENLLNKICEMQKSMQQGIPVVSRFLASYLPFWDGFTHLKPILALLPWVTFSTYEELYNLYLFYIYHLFISVNVNVKCGILNMLVKLMENLATETISTRNHLFLYSPRTEPTQDILKNILKYLNNLCILGLHFEPQSLTLLSQVLSCYEHLAMVEEKQNLSIRSVLPHVAMYYSLFSRYSTNLGRVCGLLIKYNLYCSIQSKHLTIVLSNHTEFIGALTHDFFNILWSKGALQRRKYGLIFKRLSAAEISSLPANLDVNLSLSHYPPLLCFYKHFNDNKSLRLLLKRVLPPVYQLLKLAMGKMAQNNLS